ncbi:MAG TPA: diguanylate cyclase, partial [Longimicrobiales bacterium]|nr:diguanylate cyclase [Longimicrobiales bacterium]
MTRPDSRARPVPLRALVLSLAALAVPVAGALVFPGALGEQGALLWLLALVPAFLLSYYKGWRGVATALAMGMATLSVTQAVAAWLLLRIPDLLLGVVVAYLAIAMGIGVLAEFLHRDRDVVEDLAFTDPLTRLPNRRHALVFLENEFAAAKRGRVLSVALFDLDRFKQYNDTYGHQAGDEALRTFADVLARTTRRMNLSSRFGGEEYMSVLAGSEAEGAMVFAERVRMALQAQHLGDPALTVSAGVAAFDPAMGSMEELLAAADEALYRAKRDGRNCVRLFRRGGEQAAVEAGEPATLRAASPSAPPGGDHERAVASAAAGLPLHGFGEGRRVLVVEDHEQVREVLTAYLREEGFQVSVAVDARKAMLELRTEFDVVVSDLKIPGASGHDLVSAVKAHWPATQVVVITGIQDAQVAADALNAGADRYLFKPFGMPELRSHLVDALGRRERLLMEVRELQATDGEARERADQAHEAVVRGTMALVRAVEVRDPYTRGHSARVAAYAAVLANGLDPEGDLLDRDRLQLACELHDVGKIGVPDVVLNKVGALTADEVLKVQAHPRVGRRILEPLLDDDMILAVVSWHHERWDGSGYPDRLVGETTPVAARVVGLADSLDAMTCP